MKLSNKNKLLFLGILIMGILSYKLAIEKTINARKEVSRLEQKIEEVKDIPKYLSILAQKEQQYDSILKDMDINDTSIQNNLLRIINQEAKNNHIKVIDFNEPHVHTKEDNQLYTYSFNLNGSYTNILKVIHTIEQKGNYGEVVHVDFLKEKNYKTNRNTLGATIFLQQIK